MQDLIENNLAIDDLRRLVGFVREATPEPENKRRFAGARRVYEVLECDVDELDHRYGPDWHDEPHAIAHAEWSRFATFLESEDVEDIPFPTYQVAEHELLMFGRFGMRIVGRPYIAPSNHWRTLKTRRKDALPKALDLRALPHAKDTYYQHVTDETAGNDDNHDPKKEQ